MPGMFMITDPKDDYECPYGYKEKFAAYSIEKLIETFNADHRKQAFVRARTFFYLALARAFRNSGYDCSSFISDDGYIDMKYPLKLEGNRVVQIREPEPAGEKDVGPSSSSGEADSESHRDSDLR